MQRATVARNEICPLLDQLIRQLTQEGSQTQCAYFRRIRKSLDRATDNTQLVLPILELSSSSAVGFRFSNDADALMSRILEKASRLANDLDPPPPSRH